MMNINAIKLNNTNGYNRRLSFKENNTNYADNQATLAIQGSTANFGKDLNISKAADAVQSNPVKAFFYKLYKTMKMIFKKQETTPEIEAALYTYA